MLKLYIKTGCPYCAMALGKVNDLGIDVELLNVADEGVTEELIEKGGKKQEPFLIDTERDVSMYEASDIVEYLETNYGDGKESEVKSESVEISEGGVCSVE